MPKPSSDALSPLVEWLTAQLRVEVLPGMSWLDEDRVILTFVSPIAAAAALQAYREYLIALATSTEDIAAPVCVMQQLEPSSSRRDPAAAATPLVRPDTDPRVARRLIKHALGPGVASKGESSSKEAAPPSASQAAYLRQIASVQSSLRGSRADEDTDWRKGQSSNIVETSDCRRGAGGGGTGDHVAALSVGTTTTATSTSGATTELSSTPTHPTGKARPRGRGAASAGIFAADTAT